MLSRLSILALFAFTSPSSFAAGRFSVSGAEAQAVFGALQQSGAELRHGAGAMHVRVSRVSCGEGGGIVFLPMHCSLADDISGKDLRAGAELASALEDAGVKSASVHMGELNETTLGAGLVECSRNFEGIAACSIEI